MSDHQREPSARRSFFHEILDRRVLQILGLYLGASWGVIQFVQWLTGRYELAPHLDHIAFVTCLSLIPSVVLITWFHGKPDVGRGHWTRVEKIGIPANLALTMVLVLLAIRGNDVEATTRTVTLTNEEGDQVERVVPKQEYRRQLVLYGFENRSGEAELDWLEDGIAFATSFDLSQDLFVEAEFPQAVYRHAIQETLRGKGFTGSAGVPLTLLREAAREQHVKYFTSGSFSGSAGDLVVDVTLYETQTGKAVARHEVRGEDPFTLADELSQLLKRDLDVPEAKIEEAEDLPARELLTNSGEAFELAVRGMRSYEEDPSLGRELIEQALALDDSFAEMHRMRYIICLLDNDSECVKESIEAAMRSAYRLPERLRFSVKSEYYSINGDNEKRLGLMKMGVELFPDDVDAHVALASTYSRNLQWPEAAGAFERALELAPDSYDHHHDLAMVYLRNGEPEKALEYYEAYAARFPNDALSYSQLGGFYRRIADDESSRAQYDKALLLEPDNVERMTDLGDAERYLGRWDAAREHYEKALAASRQPGERAAAHGKLEYYYRHRGQLAKALEHMEQSMAAHDSEGQRLISLINRLYRCHHYAQAGQEEKGWQLLEDVEEELEPPFDRMVTVGYLMMYVELGDAAAAEQQLAELESMLEELGDMTTGLQETRENVLGWILEERGDFEGALKHYRKGRELNLAYRSPLIDILRCQRRLGRLQEARETKQEMLRALPYFPDALYEAALFYADSGETQKSVEHLEEALAIWAEADPGFEPARRAREKLRELESEL